MGDHTIFEVENFRLQSGTVLPKAKLAYKALGRLNAEGTNVVVYCSHFGATHNECQYLIGAGLPLDPAKHFIILTNLSGNSLTSSPSNTPAPFNGPGFPLMTVHDNVRMQNLLTEALAVKRVALVLGHSMGALQSFEWAAHFPELVQAVLPICGAARISGHNTAFLLGMKSILACDPRYQNGHYCEPPIAGLKAIGRAWSAWAPAHGFYREKAYESFGFSSVDEFLSGYWETAFSSFDANDMLSQIETWLYADIAANPTFGGDFELALSSIRARAIVMPGATDAYFPVEDSAYEVQHMPNAELRPIPSTWGHWAGSGRNAADNAFIGKAVSQLLT